MAVPLVAPMTCSQSGREDVSGSADAAYALGVRLCRAVTLKGPRNTSRTLLSEAGCGRVRKVSGRRGARLNLEETLDLLRAADEAGSAGAAYNLREEHLRHGDLAVAAAALERA